MMGRNHLTLGLGVGLATAPLATDNIVSGAVWVCVVTGSSLLPDIDTEGSTITKSLGPITKVISFFVRLLTRHRGFTHRDIGIALWGLLLWWLCEQLHAPVWLAAASVVGCCAHLLGDALTRQGIRPFTFAPKWRISLSPEKAGAPSEPYVAGFLAVLGVAAMLYQVVPNLF
jgi:membrane-bound metal-dependent hydrolase YbcI (DUF457 family)